MTAIDPKGRLAIPASFRNPILKSSQNEKKVILAKNSRLPCLTGYGTSYREELLQIVRNSREQVEGGAHNFRSEYVGAAIFTLSDEVSFDASGRLILPPMLRDAAGITDLAFFGGNGFDFSLWNPHTLIEIDDPNLEPQKIAARYLLKEHEGKGK